MTYQILGSWLDRLAWWWLLKRRDRSAVRRAARRSQQECIYKPDFTFRSDEEYAALLKEHEKKFRWGIDY